MQPNDVGCRQISGPSEASPTAPPRVTTRRMSRADWCCVAGAPGFEPGNGGIKIRCLTTWLRPIRRAGPYRRAPQRSTRLSKLCCLIQDRGETRGHGGRRVLLLNRFARLGAHALTQLGIGKLAQRLGPFIHGLREETVDAVPHDLPIGADWGGDHGLAGRHHLEQLVRTFALLPWRV